MFSIRQSCNEYKTYIFYVECNDYNIHSGNIKKLRLAELNIKTGEIKDHCNPGFKYIKNLPTGVAVPWTHFDSDCLLILDLDEDDSSGALSDIDYVDTVSCKPDSIHITDIDPDVFAYNTVQKLDVFFRDIPPDGSSEYFIAQPTPGVNITGSGTQHITLTGGTAPDYKEMKAAMQNLLYRNNSVLPTQGERKIAFVGYTNTIISDTAIAHIYIKELPPSAGRDTVLQVCEDAPALILKNYLSPNSSLSGKWDGDLNTAGIFDPQTDKAGIFSYTVSSAECGSDTAHFTIKVNPKPQIFLGNDTTLCAGKTFILSAENTDALSYTWQDGSTDASFEVNISGIYSLRIIDLFGCINTDTISISYFAENDPTKIDTLLCKGKVINWHGQEIDTSGQFTYTTIDLNGCDSTTVLNVEYNNEALLSETDTLICMG